MWNKAINCSSSWFDTFRSVVLESIEQQGDEGAIPAKSEPAEVDLTGQIYPRWSRWEKMQETINEDSVSISIQEYPH